MFKMLVYFIMVYGLSNMMIFSSGPFNIFSKLRTLSYEHTPKIYELLTCMICLPTYIGFVLSLVNIVFFNTTQFTPYNILFSNSLPWFAITFFDGILTSGFVWIIHTVQMFFETNSKIEDSDSEKTLLND